MSVYGASRLGMEQLQAGIARAQGNSAPVLVSVFLDGGADALSILSPVGVDKYQDLRPNLALTQAESVAFRDDSNWRWNKRAQALDDLHRAHKMAVLPSIGYTDADQSHFTSRHYWEVGKLDPDLRTGWMGRLLDIIGDDDNPLQGLSLDGWLSPGLATASKPVAAIDGTSYDLWAPGVWGPADELMQTAIGDVGTAHASSGDIGLKAAGRVSRQAAQLHSQLAGFGEVDPPGAYPEGSYFGESLAGLATMLAAGLPVRCAALSAAGGYDTHDNQEDSLGDNLEETASSLKAFQADLEARGLADRVITIVWSEFGRRPHENGDGAGAGTDHGAAGTAFLIGTKVRDQMVGGLADLNDLDEDDNLKHSVDYRAVYSQLVGEWFGQDPAAVIPTGWNSPEPVPDLLLP
jgi:uncharacterized protein (DUF1501 family)